MIVSITIYYVLGFSYQLALLFGAVMMVTGPTVIVPMLRAIRPNQKIANILRWEGIVIDPVGDLLAVIAIVALARKFLVLDPKEYEGSMVAAFACITLSLGIVYWLLSKNSIKDGEL